MPEHVSMFSLRSEHTFKNRWMRMPLLGEIRYFDKGKILVFSVMCASLGRQKGRT